MPTLEKHFSPAALRVRLINGRWRSDLVKWHRVMDQFREEAGLRHAPWPDPPDAYDRLLSAASAHGWALETEE